MKLIFPVFRSPHKKGRYGSNTNQDWYRALIRSIEVFKAHPADTAKILLVGDFCAEGSLPEYDIYMNMLEKHGVSSSEIIYLRYGLETEAQLITAATYAEEHAYELVTIATWPHSIRVSWIYHYNHIDTKVFGVMGIPRPREFVIEWFAILLCPILDWLSLKGPLMRWINKRRKQGKL